MEARELTDDLLRRLSVKYACVHDGCWEWRECFWAKVMYVNGTVGVHARFRCHCSGEHEVCVLGDLVWKGDTEFLLVGDSIVGDTGVLEIEFETREDEYHAMREIAELAR